MNPTAAFSVQIISFIEYFDFNQSMHHSNKLYEC